MSTDDIIYLMLLFYSIGFGYFYRKIKDGEQKKIVGAVVGAIIVFIVSGFHIVHFFLTVFINAIIILFVDKSKCHIVSFVFSFLYLIFFRTSEYFGIPYAPAHTNLIQMMLTLKLVGLAFEVNNSYLAKRNAGEKASEAKLEEEWNDVDPDFLNIFYYALNYIGVLTGPYYRYKTFEDYLKLSFADCAPWKEATLNKLKYVPLYAILFLWGTYNWPLSYADADEFYNERSWLYRFWFCWPNFFIFRMRIYIGLVLSECVCTMASFGAYPIRSKPKSGLGPSTNFKELKEISDNPARLAKEELDFETIHNIHPYGSDFCTTFRDGMKNWNMCVQYWLAVNVYKRVPVRKYRTSITMLTSAIWHGVYAGYYICICSVPLYLAIEDIYVKLFIKDNNGKSLIIWEWILWFFKMQAFSYLAIAFLLLSVKRVFHYYNSIFHFGLIFGIVLYVAGLYMLARRKSKEKIQKNSKTSEFTYINSKAQ